MSLFFRFYHAQLCYNSHGYQKVSRWSMQSWRWLTHSPSERKVKCSNLVRGNQPLLTAKAVHRQSSLHVFGTGLWLGKLHEVNPLIVQWSHWEDNCWVLCTDGIKLQSLHSVRFWTSLVRTPCHDNSGAIELCWQLAIGKASLFGAGLDISMSRQLKTKAKN